MRSSIPIAEEPQKPSAAARIARMVWTTVCWSAAFGSVLAVSILLR